MSSYYSYSYPHLVMSRAEGRRYDARAEGPRQQSSYK